jgi:predicted transcriptional regulator
MITQLDCSPTKFKAIRKATETAAGIAWDTCHKIYILKDLEQVRQMREYDYDPLFTRAEKTADEMAEIVAEWYAKSCGLRFVQSVRTVYTDEGQADKFSSVIAQS